MGSHRRIALWAATLAVAVTACKAKTNAAPAPSASNAAPPVDRLAPGELAPGDDEAFGLRLPKGMVVEGRFSKTVYAHGRIRSEEVANYIRKRVKVRYVEMGAAATVFPRVQINGGPKDRVFTIEVTKKPNGTRLVIRDATPPPPAPSGLTEAQLLDRAGLTPEGKVKNPNQLE